jgi:hypothetical protein
MKGSTLKIAVAITAFLAIVMFINMAGTSIGLPAGTTDKLLFALPGIVVFFMGVITLATTGVSIFALPGFTALGLGIDILLGAVQTHAIYPIEQIGGATIAQTQWIIVIFCALIGGIIAAMSRGR